MLILPATQAVIRQANVPANNARNANAARSDFLLGANGPNPPSCIPIDEKFEKPHKAYVAMIWERSCERMKQNYQRHNAL